MFFLPIYKYYETMKHFIPYITVFFEFNFSLNAFRLVNAYTSHVNDSNCFFLHPPPPPHVMAFAYFYYLYLY